MYIKFRWKLRSVNAQTQYLYMYQYVQKNVESPRVIHRGN